MAATSKPEQDNLYLRRVKGLNQIRKVVGSRTELCLPKIVVVGDQSSGKSSALERLTSIRFPVKAGICTKAAIVAECHRDENMTADVFEIHDPEKPGFKRVELQELDKAIRNIQNGLLQESGKKVCTEEITVRVSGPQQMDISVIDLPGIIHTGDGREETRELINKYIKHPETLIMLVSEATRNDETMEAIEMAKQVDPDGKRTLRVLTKFDSFDSDDSKKTAVNLVMQNRLDCNGDAKDLSPHAVVCKPKGEDEHYCSEKENAMLAELGLALNRAGVASLKGRLPPIFAELIQTNLQHMQDSIENEARRVEWELARIGAEPVCGALMTTGCQRALLGVEKALRESISVEMKSFKLAVHEMENDLKESWAHDKLKEDMFTCVLFQGAEAFRECTQDVMSWWKPLLQNYVKGAEAKTKEVLGVALRDVQGVPDGLRKVIYMRMERFFHQELFRDFRKCCWDAFEKEVDWGTVNHYFSSKYDAERKLPAEFVEEFVNSVQQEHLYPAGQLNLAHAKKSLRDLLVERKAMFEKRFSSLSMHQQQQTRLFHAVQAWYAVEKKTFTDVVLKATKAHVLEGQRQWVQSRLLSDEEVVAAAVEDDETRGKRAHLKDLSKRLEQCLSEVRGMM